MRQSFTILIGILLCALTVSAATSQPAVVLPGVLSTQITEARQLLEQSAISRDRVVLAAFDSASEKLTTIPLSKEEFLTRGAEIHAITNSGQRIQVQVIRANGVNTAVTITDTNTGESLVPLMVQYPIVRDGSVNEVAYYTSAHPALFSSDLTTSGQTYVRMMLDQAAASLSAQNVQIPVDIIDIAEHLCVVEHTDHKRFTTEDAGELFPEILSLYALNQGNTYRYSVSTAGAGGMIQMIPKTYEAIRKAHPNVPLETDFVSGMRNHANATKAMLLYINDTWNGLAGSDDVQQAMESGIATKSEILAAGYNSNPARLSKYLREGGVEWRTLIPAETQMYLKIYASVDKHLDFVGNEATANASVPSTVTFNTESPIALRLLSWLGKSLSKSVFSIF
jgi:hypothetical protein